MKEKTDSGGTVQRWEYSDDSPPKLWHRNRDTSLFTETEWDWTLDRKKAYIFPTYEEAEQHAEELKAAGVEHVHAFVHSADESLLQERHARHERDLENTLASVPRQPSPDEVFAREERRHLA